MSAGLPDKRTDLTVQPSPRVDAPATSSGARVSPPRGFFMWEHWKVIGTLGAIVSVFAGGGYKIGETIGNNDKINSVNDAKREGQVAADKLKSEMESLKGDPDRLRAELAISKRDCEQHQKINDSMHKLFMMARLDGGRGGLASMSPTTARDDPTYREFLKATLQSTRREIILVCDFLSRLDFEKTPIRFTPSTWTDPVTTSTSEKAKRFQWTTISGDKTPPTRYMLPTLDAFTRNTWGPSDFEWLFVEFVDVPQAADRMRTLLELVEQYNNSSQVQTQFSGMMPISLIDDRDNVRQAVIDIKYADLVSCRRQILAKGREVVVDLESVIAKCKK